MGRLERADVVVAVGERGGRGQGPESLGALMSLVYLDLRGNRLRSLPASLGDLPNIEKLDLRWNKLGSLPGWVEGLERRGCVVLA